MCGNVHPDTTNSAKLADSSCDTHCPGDTKQFCGGHVKNSVYETGNER